jgi:putative MATE family efflux protein
METFLNRYFGQTGIRAADIWKIAYPIILGSLSQNIINITDTAFLGRVGMNELAASALASTFYFLFITIGMGFTIGTQILISRRRGEMREIRIGRILNQALLFMAVLGLMVFTFFQSAASHMLRPLIQSEPIFLLANQYISTRSFGILFVFMMLPLSAFFIGIGKTKATLYASLISSSCNTILDYVLIFGKLGLPAMGLKGAALASGLSELAGFIFLAIYFLKTISLRQFGIRFQIVLHADILRQNLKVSLPIMLQHLISIGGWTSFFLIVEKMGELELAVSNIIRSIYIVLLIPVWGFATAVNVQVSFLMGAGRSKEVMAVIKKAAFLCTMASIGLVFLLSFFPQEILRIYTSDKFLISQAASPLQVVFWAGIALSVAVVFFNGVTGTGNTRTTLLIETIVIAVYLTYVFAASLIWHASLSVVWASEIVYSLILFGLSGWYLSTGKWKTTRV